MNQIRPWLFVGNFRETESLDLLTEHGIGAMLQLHRHVKHNSIAEN